MKSVLVLLAFLPSIVFADGIATDAEVKKAAVKYDLECDDEISVERIPYKDSVFISASCRMGAYNHYGILFVDTAYSDLTVIPLSTPYLGQNGKIAGWMSEVINPALTWDAETQELVSENKGGMAEYLWARYKIHEGYVVLRKYSHYGMKNDDFVETVIYQAEGDLD